MIRFLSLADVADRTGIPHATLKSLAHRGQMPEPDVEVGVGEQKQRRVRGWTADTIDAWIESRNRG